jgi:putative membrane protein insertion efficiency factor
LVSIPVRRRLWIGGAVLALLFLAVDGARPADRQWTARALVAAIHLYQATGSRLMPRIGVRCRFIPTCSHYGEGAIRKYGVFRGTFLTVRRVARCGPWTPAGTYDPP